MTETNKYFEYTADLIPGTTARSGVVDASFQGVQTALDEVEGDMFRSIRFTAGAAPAEADMQVATDAATRANQLLGFDDDGNPAVVTGGGSWAGDWATSTTYLARSFVRSPVSHYYSIYISTVEHVAGVFATDLAAGKWELMIDLEDAYRSQIRHQIITANHSAVQGDDLMISVASGNVTVTLPASPVLTSPPINFMHIGGELGVDGILTIARNGKNIMDLAENMVVDVENASFGLAWSNNTHGWRVRGV